jgi:hypothetical protein
MMRILLALLCVALIGVPAALAQPVHDASGPAAAASDAFSGTWESHALSLTLQRVGDHYTGTATAGGRRFPLQSEVHDGVMTGIFSDDRVLQIFQASVAGDLLRIAAGGAQLVLSRQTVAPVSAPAGAPASTARVTTALAPISSNPNGSPVVEVDGKDPFSCP